MANSIWPIFDIEIRTPRLRLFVPTDGQLMQLYEDAAGAIHDPDEMPFSEPWTRGESPERERSAMQFQWSIRANLKPEAWHLEFAVEFEGKLVGFQGLFSEKFPVARQVETGSWLLKDVQGRGIGKEMRAAVLHFAFATLGSESAFTAALEWNDKSQGVTRSLGYEPNGYKIAVLDDKRQRLEAFVLSRQRWERGAKNYVPVEVKAPEAALEMLGAR